MAKIQFTTLCHKHYIKGSIAIWTQLNLETFISLKNGTQKHNNHYAMQKNLLILLLPYSDKFWRGENLAQLAQFA